MHRKLEADMFLAPEPSGSLAAAANDEEQPLDDDEAAPGADAWARHAQRPNGFGRAVLRAEDDGEPPSLQEAIRHVLELDWY